MDAVWPNIQVKAVALPLSAKSKDVVCCVNQLRRLGFLHGNVGFSRPTGKVQYSEKKSHIAVRRIFQLANLSYLAQVAEWKGPSFINGKKSFSRGSSQQEHNSSFHCCHNSPVGLPRQAGNIIGQRQKASEFAIWESTTLMKPNSK